MAIQDSKTLVWNERIQFLKEYNGKDLSDLDHIKELNVKSNAALYN